MVRLTDHLNMTIVIDWDIKPQNKKKIQSPSVSKFIQIFTNGCQSSPVSADD